MGVYYKIINVDLKQMVCPGELGEGLKGKLLFQTWTHRVLTWLLQAEATSGYGPREGSWANCKLSIVADYGDAYENANEDNGWVDVGPSALLELCELYEFREKFLEDNKNVGAWDKNLIALIAKVKAIKPG